MKRFWIVAQAKCQIISTRRHDTSEEARHECERLAEKEGRRFIMFEAVGLCGPVEPVIEWEDSE